MANPKFLCPQCKQKTGVNILYGYPTIEAFEQSERNEIKFGGCVLMEGQPERHCTSCEHEWQIVRRKPLWDIPEFPL
jgi:hypothetical protein